MKYLCFILSLLLLLSAGCKKENPATFSEKDMSLQDVFFFIAGTNKVKATRYFDVVDIDYSVPTERWFNKVFVPEFKKFVISNDIPDYITNKNDCDKKVNYAISVAYLLNKKFNQKNNGITIGEFAYVIPGTSLHDILMVIVTGDDGKLKLLFYDPSSFKRVDISQAQMSFLCYDWRM